jgi:2-oxoglutarate dehydrogenase E2 component (dihydrolipoamide succinyltransferase)
VIQGADGKRLRAIAREISDLARRTGAIINQPQVAILATDGVKKRPVVVQTPDGGDAIAIHPVGNIALTWDHRAFDGAYAASFTSRVREILETRDWASEL